MTGEGKTRVSLHSIEVRNAGARKVLFDVFRGFDGIHPEVKYLTFLAPFRQFFWRWDAFEKAVEQQEDPAVRPILVHLRAIVRRELADAFAVSKELTSNGVITYKYLWTLFPPGELVYWDADGSPRLALLQSLQLEAESDHAAGFYDLSLRFVDDDGIHLGWCVFAPCIRPFRGSRKITSLHAFPPSTCPTSTTSGRGAESAAGSSSPSPASTTSRTGPPRPRAAMPHGDGSEKPAPAADSKTHDRRIIVDARSRPGRPLMVFHDYPARSALRHGYHFSDTHRRRPDGRTRATAERPGRAARPPAPIADAPRVRRRRRRLHEQRSQTPGRVRHRAQPRWPPAAAPPVPGLALEHRVM